MSTSNRLISALFTALPGLLFMNMFLLTRWLGRDYWWGTYLIVLTVLMASGLFLGFAFPTAFKKLRMRQPWMWILVQGLLAWIIALLILGLLNATPLCVGQDNGDGNNDFGMCMFMTVLSGIVYTPVYLGLLTVSAVIGQAMLSWAAKRN